MGKLSRIILFALMMMFTATSYAYSWTITASAGSNGSISPAGAVSASEGSAKSFIFTPATGYRVAEVLVDSAPAETCDEDGECFPVASPYVFSNVTGDHTIAVSFEAMGPAPATHMITASAGSNGSISPAGAVSASEGSAKSFIFTPATGYRVAEVLVDSAPAETCDEDGDCFPVASPYVFSNVTGDHTIAVSFEAMGPAPATHMITASAGSNGSISPAGAVSASEGSAKSFIFTPATGYRVAEVLVDSAPAETCDEDGECFPVASPYVFSNVTGDHTIAVSFEAMGPAPATHMITASAGSNGSISPAGAVSASEGSAKSFIFTPATGYRVAEVLVDSAPAETCDEDGDCFPVASPYVFSNVTGDHTIAVSFEAMGPAPATHMITASAGSNGSISPAGAVSASEGSAKSFIFTPATGYRVAEVLVDSAPAETCDEDGDCFPVASPYVFSNVTGDHTIAVSFEAMGPAPATHMITASAGSNGSISPAGAVSASEGSAKSFIFTPATGYRVAEVLVDSAPAETCDEDGECFPVASPYVFSNVTGDHTIAVSFEAMGPAPLVGPWTITASADPLAPDPDIHGAIDPPGDVTVAPGNNQVFNFNPDLGYQVAEIWVDSERLEHCYLEEAPDVYDCVPVTSSSYIFTNVTAPHSISVLFAATSLSHIPVLLEMYYPYYSIQDAYNASVSGETIYVQSRAFGDSLIFDQDLTVTLKGGYDANFTNPPTGQTLIYVAGGPALTISDGMVIVDNIILR